MTSNLIALLFLLSFYPLHLFGGETFKTPDGREYIISKTLSQGWIYVLYEVYERGSPETPSIVKTIKNGGDSSQFYSSLNKTLAELQKLEGSPITPGLEISKTIDGLPILIMEKVDNVLGDLIKQPESDLSFRLKLVNSILSQALPIIEQLKSIGIVHTDLHPGNIGFLKGRVLLLDPDSIMPLNHSDEDRMLNQQFGQPLSEYMKNGHTYKGALYQLGRTIIGILDPSYQTLMLGANASQEQVLNSLLKNTRESNKDQIAQIKALYNEVVVPLTALKPENRELPNKFQPDNLAVVCGTLFKF